MNQNRINLKYEILLNLIKQESHGRELTKTLQQSLTTIQRDLKELEKENILEFKISGRNKIYSIKKNSAAKRYLFNAENYKLIKVIKRYPFLDPIFEDVLKKTNSQIIILFGSYAKFKAKKDSDIDFYIETDNKKTKREIELINSKINVKIGKFSLHSLLIKEIIKNHVILRGLEKYYEKIKFFE